MSDTMSIEDYLASGGKLTAPGNVPPRYRGELMRIMASFVDSELAAAAGFADTINDAPGIRNRIAAAQIVAQKLDHAGRVLRIMGEFGADTERYQNSHPWAARLDRNADLSEAQRSGDMRLSVFHFPVQGYVDAVVLNVLMGLAAEIQTTEMARISYAPLAEVFRDIAVGEARHTRLGLEGLKQIVATPDGRDRATQSVAYWLPRVDASFGQSGSRRFGMLHRLGLRHAPNDTLRDQWKDAVKRDLTPLELI